MFPTDDLAEFWSQQCGAELTGASALGLRLIVDGGMLRSAGRSDLPATFPSGSAWAPPGAQGRAAVVLHDVAADRDGLDAIQRAVPEARIYLRYECAAAEFGKDPEMYFERVLSAKRRKRLRHDLRQLEAVGEVSVRWVQPDEADAMFERFFRMLCARAAVTRLYDPNLLRHDYLRALWRRFAGDDLLVSVMRVGEDPVSFRTGFAVGERFVGYMPAIDRSFSSASMGDVHMQQLVGELAERGLTSYWMGKGALANKDVWATGSYRLWTIVIPCSRSLKARALVAAEGARQRLRRAVTANRWDRPLRRVLHVLGDRPGSEYRRALNLVRSSA